MKVGLNESQRFLERNVLRGLYYIFHGYEPIIPLHCDFFLLNSRSEFVDEEVRGHVESLVSSPSGVTLHGTIFRVILPAKE